MLIKLKQIIKFLLKSIIDNLDNIFILINLCLCIYIPILMLEETSYFGLIKFILAFIIVIINTQILGKK